MGFYSDNVVPRLVDWTCSTAALDHWRSKVCEGLKGDMVEIGFGSGTNINQYPPALTHVYAIEPAPLARKLARKRVARSPIAIEHVGLDGQALPLANESCDSALSTFTLCTIDDPGAALAEVMRVLRPGGELHFLEHGIAPDPSTAKWQRRLNGVEQRLAGGCQLTRDPLALLRDAGFDLQWSEQCYAKGPKPWSYFTVGVAVKAHRGDEHDSEHTN